jgi:hypothetical protein
MSLLTNEQIAELIGIASNQSTSRDLHDEFREWNEKQTGVQVNVDWSKAPECADRAEVNFYWVGEDTWRFCFQIAKYDRPKPVITPHPHAEMIMKYAEVAQRRTDPWVEFEIFGADGEQWVTSKSHLQFHACCKYRHIGETK